MKTGKLWKLIAPMLLLVAVFSLMPKMNASAGELATTRHMFDGVNEEDAYVINNVDDLIEFSARVNSGEEFQNAVLMADITFPVADLGVSNFEAIGSKLNKFKGKFDGNNHTIKGLVINKPDNDDQGLFGFAERALIQNVRLEGGSIVGKYFVGGVCGTISTGTIQNCMNIGAVSGVFYIGGVCGSAFSSIQSEQEFAIIQNCVNTGSVSGADFVGGVCGSITYWTMKNCMNTGSVSGENYVGGICGYIVESSSAINCCINTGMVSGETQLGGVLGWDNGTASSITNCYYDRQMSPVANSIGRVAVDASITDVEGKLSTEMTGEALKANLGGVDWDYTENMYPRLKSMKDTDAAKLAATPIFLHVTDDATYDTVASVTQTFTIGTGNGVTWNSSNPENLYVSNTNQQAIFLAAKEGITLTAQLGNASKSITLNAVGNAPTQDGTKEHPLLINSVEDLIAFRDAVNSNSEEATYNGAPLV